MKVEQRKAAFRLKRNKQHTVQKVTKKAHSRLKTVWDDAVRAYLRALILDEVIKVDSGMSKASLLPLARYLRMLTEVRSTINPKRDEVKGSFDIDGNWRPNINRTMALGEASSTRRAGYNVLYGGPKRMVFQFDFEITVFQYLVNERGLGTDNAWNTIDKGRAAMQAYLEANFVLFDFNEWKLHG